MATHAKSIAANRIPILRVHNSGLRQDKGTMGKPRVIQCAANVQGYTHLCHCLKEYCLPYMLSYSSYGTCCGPMLTIYACTLASGKDPGLIWLWTALQDDPLLNAFATCDINPTDTVTGILHLVLKASESQSFHRQDIQFNPHMHSLDLHLSKKESVGFWLTDYHYSKDIRNGKVQCEEWGNNWIFEHARNWK